MIRAWNWLDQTAGGRFLLAILFFALAIFSAHRDGGTAMTYILFFMTGANAAFSTNPPQRT